MVAAALVGTASVGSSTSPAMSASVPAVVYFDQVGADIDGRSPEDGLGASVALSADGDRIAVAAGAGYVRVFDWDGSAWSQVGDDIVLDTVGNLVGTGVLALSADGVRLAIGDAGPFSGTSSGRVLVFDWNGDAWSQVGDDIAGDGAEDRFGSAVALSADGDRVAATAATEVRLFDWDGAGWSQVGDDIVSDGEWGRTVALSADGDRVAVGGTVRIYDWGGGQWSHFGADDETGFGESVALSGTGDRLAIGRHGNDDDDTMPGSVLVLEAAAGSWVVVDESPDVPVNAVALSSDGHRLVYSAASDFGGFGRTVVRDETDSGWADVGDISGEDIDDGERAIALTADGDRVAIGSVENFGDRGPRGGHVRMFDLTPTQPSPPAPPVSVTPARLLETRADGTTVDGVSEGIGRRDAGSVTEVQVAGRGGVPDAARAAMLNVAVVQAGGPGFVTMYPCGSDPPLASSLNHDTAGQTLANSVFTEIGVDGKVCIYTLAATDLVVDVTGYTPVSSALLAVGPSRLMDTRTGEVMIGYETWNEVDRAPALSVTELWVTSRGGVPSLASAVMLNVAVVQPDGPGFVTVYPCGPMRSRPTASTVNYTAGQTIASSAFVEVGEFRRVCIYTLATADIVVDVTGYTLEPPEPTPVRPTRLVETRPGDQTVDGEFEGIGRRSAGSVTEVQVSGRGGVPADAAAVMLNVAVVDSGGPGFVTVYPCRSRRPTASNINHEAGQTIANSVFTRIGANGTVCIYTLVETDLIVDVTGYT